MLNVLTGKNEFYEDVIGKKFGTNSQISKPHWMPQTSVRKNNALALENLLLYDEEPFAISMMQPDIAVKSTISCNRFFIIILFFAFKHYETDNKRSPVLLS